MLNENPVNNPVSKNGLLDALEEYISMQQQAPDKPLFTVPQLSRGQDWYVFYYYFNPSTGQHERVRKRLNINRYKKFGVEKLEEYAQSAVKFMHQALKDGYNPFVAKIKSVLAK